MCWNVNTVWFKCQLAFWRTGRKPEISTLWHIYQAKCHLPCVAKAQHHNPNDSCEIKRSITEPSLWRQLALELALITMRSLSGSWLSLGNVGKIHLGTYRPSCSSAALRARVATDHSRLFYVSAAFGKTSCSHCLHYWRTRLCLCTALKRNLAHSTNIGM